MTGMVMIKPVIGEFVNLKKIDRRTQFVYILYVTLNNHCSYICYKCYYEYLAIIEA